MQVYVGLDGGGTRTRLWAGGRAGPPLGQFEGGGASLSRRSAAEVELELAGVLHRAFGALGLVPADCAAVCGGFASAGRHAADYEAMLHRLLPRARVRVLTDAELAWHAATGGEDGIVVVAGTGSIVWGRYQGRFIRVGGQGPGQDPGSADWIGREAVARGMIAPPEDGNYAGLLPGLAQAAAHADPIARQAAKELAIQLEECARALGWLAPVVYTVGGVFEHMPAVGRYLRLEVPYSFLPARTQPVEAALELARAMPGE